MEGEIIMKLRAENDAGNRIRNRVIDGIVFILLLAAASAVTLTLFYRQTMGSPAMYHSDMKAYILEMQGLDSGYQYPYPIFFKLSALIHLFAGPELSVAIATMLLNSLAMVVTKLAFNHLAIPDLEGCFQSGRGGAVRKDGAAGSAAIRKGADGKGAFAGKSAGARSDMSWLAGVIISLASVSLFFISMLYPPKGIYLPGIKFIYLGVFTANPFHNATYMAARPFAILAFLWYVKLLPTYEQGIAKRGAAREKGIGDYALFSLFLLLATMTKPSFTLAMVSTAGLIMLYRLFRARFRNFVPTAQLGICFVPTFLDLLYQYKGVFIKEDGAEGGLGFCLGEVWANYCDNIPLAICLAVGFPLLVLVLNRKECRKNTLFAFSWQLYLVSFAEAFFLYEKGFRKVDFNFCWGYMCGIFFCHFSALLLLLRATAGEIAGNPDGGVAGETVLRRASVKGNAFFLTLSRETFRRIRIFLLILQWLAYLWHVVCGIFYFRTLFGGAMYY